MKLNRKLLIAGAVIVAGGFVGTGAVLAGRGGDDVDVSINGAELDQATQAALAHTGEGRVTGTEVGDEESYYEVEVTLDDGSQVDVQLDRDFTVVGDEVDGPEDDGADDD